MTKFKKNNNEQTSSIFYIFIGIIILFIALIAIFNWGFFGSLVINTFRLFVGETYDLLLLIIAIYGTMLIYKRRIYNVSFWKFIGGFLVLLSFCLYLHLRDFYPQEPLSDNIFRLTYDIFKNEYITGQNQILMGGGMIGALMYQLFTYLLGIEGSYLLAVFMFIVGLMILTNITFETVIKSVKSIFDSVSHFLKNVSESVTDAKRNYQASFSQDIIAEIDESDQSNDSSSLDSTYEKYINYDSVTLQKPKTSIFKGVKHVFSKTNQKSYNRERDYQLPMEKQSNVEWDNYSEFDPIAQRAHVERQRLKEEKQIVLDLDYFDLKNSDKTSYQANQNNVSSYQDTRLESVIDEDTLEELPQDFELKDNTSREKIIDERNLATNHWQSKSNQVEDTTYDELDEVLKKSNQANNKAKKDKRKRKGYQLPGKDLLTKIPPVDQSEEYARINDNIKKLELTFDSFGVDAKVIKANLGPAVTKYEIEPGVGVKVSKIVSLSDDIALALAARDIRMEAPIPGKSLIGIEVPNTQVSPVSFWEVIDPALKSNNLLEVPLGRDISGSVCLADLTKMPHLLIAGATGSGKSVGMNVIIVSLLMKAKPHEVKFLMIDPKKVELTMYDELPHLLTPVVTNPRKAAQALNNVVQEMENRYELFAAAGARNIDGYNEYVEKLNQEKNTGYEKLPKIVVFIDELADLMLVASNDVENAIIRLAQMARAAGIHMIIATQRPSVDVITGIIKANVPSRLAFAVSSGTDSRTILDSIGAEKLLGRGDMLFQPMGRSKPLRVQGAYISDQEVERITDFIKEQSEPEYNENIMVTEESMELSQASDDEYFQEAVELIMDQETVSISQLQRKFRIGYNRAARLIDDLEAMGYVSEQDGSKPRQVLINE